VLRRALSLALAAGEVYGLLGPNGAGKSTTIAMLSGLLVPTSGRVVVAGHDLAREPRAAKLALGVVPQDIALYPTLSARENLRFFGEVYGLRGQGLRSRMDEVLEVVRLADRAGDRVATYSGGMKRRLNLAVALLHRPRVLYLDEPTVGVDPQSRQHIFDNVLALAAGGAAVLYTTHYMEEAQKLCTRLAVVDRGVIVAEGTPAALVAAHGQGLLRVTVSEAPPETLAALRAAPEIRDLQVHDHTLVLEAADAQAALTRVVAVLAGARITVQALEVAEPNLESVFLHLTGRSLRD
jgi:ABC-2 type transport system ATP-binding protein